MTHRDQPWFVFVESNTTGTGRQFCAAATARGLRPLLLAKDPARYPYAAADGIDTLGLDTADLDALLDACTGPGRGAVAGVGTSSEYFVAPAAALAAKLGLPGPDAEAVARCRRKDLQRALLAAAGVPVPAFRVATDADGAVAAAGEIGYPVVVKPVSGSGSTGVRLCRDAAEAGRWAGALLARPGDERGSPVPRMVLVEEAVEGPEFSVETFDGETVAVVGKHLGAEPYFVETGHDVPAPVPAETADALGATARQALAALGLGFGAAHTELRRSARGPVVIEVNPRLAGGMIPAAVKAALGVDLVDAVVARASGGPFPPVLGGAGHAAIRFLLAPRAGRVSAVGGLDEAVRSPGVELAHVTAARGLEVRLTRSFQDRLGYVVAGGADAAQAASRAGSAAGLIRIEWEEEDK
jgi:S-sulfo-L-cysteine synthase (3-phospho-L-serine-dependent)